MAGYDGHITKPVNAGELIRMIAAVLTTVRSKARDLGSPDA